MSAISKYFRGHIEWLEGEPLRIRKFLAVFVTYVWTITLILTVILSLLNFNIIDIFGVVTAQFATIIIFYMSTKAYSDNPNSD